MRSEREISIKRNIAFENKHEASFWDFARNASRVSRNVYPIARLCGGSLRRS